MRLVIESIARGTDLPHGWIDAGTESVTIDNVAEVIARETSIEATVEYYQARIEEIFADPEAMTRPLEEQRQ